ncbi:class I SAM-dependent methyltransferase [Pontivivens insulae]|uniref:Ubiquinone biosynthesis O-methyltransferase n=1 Tax=Pontivivens insulae TaxID=1639689 RepID=A0A2R8AE94_9RHOB|nr:class I SAM-dependent methyltransferase [Pontivivens insulae]RED11779.1 methyltransferase family protein [Pontivivens insulae]SPF30536.1 Ubiquinone biosynthesis O-methyltransferase [Pontivivens insulae]
MTNPIRPCPSCTSAEANTLPAFSQDEWRVAECTSCRFVYLTNPPSYDALVEEFAWEKQIAEVSEAKPRKGGRSAVAKMRAGLRSLRPTRSEKFLKLLGGGKVLDIGCGGGHRMEPPFVPYGIEISKAQYQMSDELMRSRGGYCIHGAGADAIWDFPEGHFDAVMMHSYLEHEVEVDRVLQGAARALRPGGRVYVRVPNFGSVNRKVRGRKWCGFRWPDHVNYFTASSLRRVAVRAGFEMRIVNRLNLMFDDNIQALLIKPDTAPAPQS